MIRQDHIGVDPDICHGQVCINLDPAVERPLECVPRGAPIANRPRRNEAS
jgi:hypothetical protein